MQAPGKDGIRRTRWAVVRNTYSQLEDTSIKTLHYWLPPDAFGIYSKADHNYIVKIDDAEFEIMFRALDRPDHVRKLLSLELTGAWVNEAREVPLTIIRNLLGRTGRFPAQQEGGCTWNGIFMDTNPPDVDSWWYRLFEIDKPDNCAIFKQPGGLSAEAENLKGLIAGYYQEQAELNKGNQEWIKVYINGEYGFVIDGKPVYPEYRDSTHCREGIEPVKGITIKRGWDFGLTPCCVFVQQLANGRTIVFDELVSEDMGIDRFGDIALDYTARNYPGYTFEDIGDPAGAGRAQTDEKSCFDILRAKGVNIQPGQQTPKIRIESVKKPLTMMVDGEPGFLLSPQCKTLRKGFMGGYQYRRLQVRGDKYTDVPDKNNYSHPHDALQYVLSSYYSGSLQAKNQNKFDYHAFYNR